MSAGCSSKMASIYVAFCRATQRLRSAMASNSWRENAHDVEPEIVEWFSMSALVLAFPSPPILFLASTAATAANVNSRFDWFTSFFFFLSVQVIAVSFRVTYMSCLFIYFWKFSLLLNYFYDALQSSFYRACELILPVHYGQFSGSYPLFSFTGRPTVCTGQLLSLILALVGWLQCILAGA